MNKTLTPEKIIQAETLLGQAWYNRQCSFEYKLEDEKKSELSHKLSANALAEVLQSFVFNFLFCHCTNSIFRQLCKNTSCKIQDILSHFHTSLFTEVERKIFYELSPPPDVLREVVNILSAPSLLSQFDKSPTALARNFGSCFEGTLAYKPKTENFLFESDRSRLKAKGTFYTDPDLTSCLVKLTFDDMATSGACALDQKVLDPAMGAGHFLLEVLEYFVQHQIDNPQTENHQSEHHQAVNQKSDLFDLKQKILSKCIFGADKDQLTFKISKMCLALACLNPMSTTEQINQVLGILDKNLFCVDSLLMDWTKIFDCVTIIGNPPFVSTYSRQSQKNNIDNDIQNYLQKFNLNSNRHNLFSFFVANNVWLQEQNVLSKWAFVLPRPILVSKHLGGLRQLILKNSISVNSPDTVAGLHLKIVELDYLPFNAGVEICLVCAVYTKAKKYPENSKLPIYQNSISYFTKKQNGAPQFQFTQTLPRGDARTFENWNSKQNPKIKSELEKIKSHVLATSLEELGFKVFDGINPGPFSKEFFFTELSTEIYSEICTEIYPKPAPTVSELIQPQISIKKGQWIKPYQIEKHEPYYFVGNSKLLEALYSKYPDKQNSRAVFGDLSRFDKIKLIYRQSEGQYIAALDESGLRFKNNCHGIICNRANPTAYLKLLLTWLNSPLANWIYSHQFKEKSFKPQIKIAHTKKMPIPNFDRISVKDSQRLLYLCEQLCINPENSEAKTEIQSIYCGIFNVNEDIRFG